MIESIKNEIEEEVSYYDEEDPGDIDKPTLFKILDKYQNQEYKYKQAWEELKSIYNHDDTKSKNEIMILGKIREIEIKNKIGGNL